MADWLDLALVFAIGSLVGTGELVSRFRDEPARAVVSRPGFLYLAVNGLASAFALVALRTLGWTPGEGSVEQTRLLQILAAGVGAMAIFRTALFTVRVSGTDVGVGPVAFLQIMLAALDRAVDRKRARERADRVIKIMDGLTFEQLALALPAFNVALMQNLATDDINDIGEGVQALSERQMPPEAKVLNLGLLLMNYVGEGVLEEAVLGLRRQLQLPDPFAGHRGIRIPTFSRTSDRTSTPEPEAIIESRPPSERVSPPPGTTAHGTSLSEVEEHPPEP